MTIWLQCWGGEGPNSENEKERGYSDNEGEDYKYIDGEGHVQSEKVSTVAFLRELRIKIINIRTKAFSPHAF